MKVGRSSHYAGSETPTRATTIKPYENTGEIIRQFEHMAAGLAPKDLHGNSIVWVADPTITDEDRAWARETARMLRLEAEKQQNMKPLEPMPIRRRADQLEAEIAAFLALRPDATPNEVKRVTGIEHGRVLRSEAWAMTHMSRKEGG